MKKFLCAAAMAVLMCSQSWAAFDLQVTEIFPGQGGSNDLTDDWYELTNFGTSAWTAAVDGPIFYDDVSADPNDAVELLGVTSIAPGESAIFVEGDPNAALEWISAWSDVVSPLPQVGSYDGSGLGGGGDTVTLFLDADMNGDAFGDAIIESASFPEVPLIFDGSTFDVSLNTWSTAGIPAFSIPATPGAIVTTQFGGDDLDTPNTGSPGFALVPEPASVALVACGMIGLLGVRRK